MALPLSERKSRLASLLTKPPNGMKFSDHAGGDGEAFRCAACRHGLEGLVSKWLDRRHLPDVRGAWVRSKCLNRGEFVIVGWSDPERTRPFLGPLLLGFHDGDGRLLYAGRVGTGMSRKALALLHRRPRPLSIRQMPLAAPPPRELAFRRQAGSFARGWVRPELVAEFTYLPGRRTASFATASSSVCAKTNQPAKRDAGVSELRRTTE